jgi:hypothetical protein
MSKNRGPNLGGCYAVAMGTSQGENGVCGHGDVPGCTQGAAIQGFRSGQANEISPNEISPAITPGDPQVHLEIPRRTWQVRFFGKKTHTRCTWGSPGASGGTNATTCAPFAIAFGVKARL